MQVSDSGKKKYAETKRLIRKAMSERQFVLFVGAGASVDAGMPFGGEAVSQIADKLNLDGQGQKRLDNLIIPQYYYNARGRKEYTQLMREIFRYNDKLYPGPIQDAIIRFDAETIVTTNYDHLIEQAAENNGEFIYVVSQDTDLPYRKAGKELIKMHGDFEHDNFVLKEDDYLHYHKNFKLIENYIKSLIGTKTVLFIGYSFGDPDVKHIFSWVKEILDEHFQRAYIIITGRDVNQNEIEYFRHLGVNIIYSTELFAGYDDLADNRSDQLLQTLYYILDDEEKQKGLVDSLYEYLKPFAHLKYTYRKYIDRAFNRLRIKVNNLSTLRIDNDKFLTWIGPCNSDEGKAFLNELNCAVKGEIKNPKTQTIAEVLRRSTVWGTKCMMHEDGEIHVDKKEFSCHYTEPEWIKAIIDFDYDKLNQLKDYNSRILSESRPELYLQQAYICSFLGDYLSAYYCLSNAANYFYRKKEYAWYFISLWNKKNIARIISTTSAGYIHSTGLSADIRESIKSEYAIIDLDKTLKTIPDIGNDNNCFLRDLKDFKFASDLFYDVASNSMKASTQSNETYFLFAGMPAYEEMRQQVYDYYYYTIYNCLIVDRYRENNEIFNLFARSIFSSVSAPDKESSEKSINVVTGNIHAGSLRVMDIHLILRYIDANKLRKLFNEFSIIIVNVDAEGLQYLQKLIKNTIHVFDLGLHQESDIFWRVICFVSHVSLDKGMAVDALKALIGIQDSEYIISKQQSLVELINVIYAQRLYTDKEICAQVKKLITKLINIVSHKRDSLRYYEGSIVLLMSVCAEGNCLYDDYKAVQSILSEDYYLLLADIHGGCADNIKAIINDLFKNWTCPDTYIGYIIYSKIVLAEMISPDKAVEDKAIDFLIEQNNREQKEIEQVIKASSEDNLMLSLINLYLVDYIINVDRLKEIVQAGNDEFSKWLIDVDGYDYTKFELQWLKQCYPSLLKKVAENEKVRKTIVSLYKDKYLSEYIDNSTNEIVIQYFI